jgi:hypothetical protein
MKSTSDKAANPAGQIASFLAEVAADEIQAKLGASEATSSDWFCAFLGLIQCASDTWLRSCGIGKTCI